MKIYLFLLCFSFLCVDCIFSAKLSDTTPPTVSITSPTANATVSGALTVQVNASDNFSVTSVSLKVDGTLIGSPDTTSPYTFSLDTTTLTNAVHTLTATAQDVGAIQVPFPSRLL